MKVNSSLFSSLKFIPETPVGFIDGDEFLARFQDRPGMAERLVAARQRIAERERSGSDFRETLASLRREAGMSQQQLADKIGTKQPNISMYESGEREPSLSVVAALSGALGVSYDRLIPALKHG